jgi:SAM-dependent methyltransferase
MTEQLLEIGINKDKIIYPGRWLNEILTDKEALLIVEKSIFCPCCQQNTWVVSEPDHEYYFCENCQSFPWHRAIIKQINRLIGNDISRRSLYEVAPQGSSSMWLEENAGIYTASHYWPDIPFGSQRCNLYSQNLEALTFPNEVFDIVVTQVVFEHIFNPKKAFAEIERVLKQGGLHIFTIPFFPNTKTVTRAVINQAGKVEHLKEPVYHGNPISADGALVTFDWGDDIVELISEWTGMVTEIYVEEEDYRSGIKASSHVFVSRKE